MNKLILALVGVVALSGLSMSAQAAPASSLPRLSTAQSMIEPVYCRRHKVCHGYGYERRCHWVRRCH